MKKIDQKFIVKEEDTLLKYLLSNVLGKSKNNIKTLLKNGNVSVNNKPTTKHDFNLKKGDQITFGESIRVSKMELDIIYEDRDLIAINKPAGLLSIATDKEKEKTAYHYVSNYLKQSESNAKIFVLHRLDKDTSGVLVFAKSEKIKEILQSDWNRFVSKRGYYAIVNGKLPKEEDTLINYLKETTSKRVYVSDTNDGEEAITHYKVNKYKGKYSLVELDIKTGKKNQIRVQLAHIGNSIIGDKKYGLGEDTIKRLALHAHILVITNPLSRKEIVIKAEWPKEFNKLI